MFINWRESKVYNEKPKTKGLGSILDLKAWNSHRAKNDEACKCGHPKWSHFGIREPGCSWLGTCACKKFKESPVQELKAFDWDHWFAFANILRIITQKDFTWTVNATEKSVLVIELPWRE